MSAEEGKVQFVQTNKHSNLSQIIRDTLSSKSGKEKLPFGFYWTRKSPTVAESLIRAFSAKESVVMDPFLGSGTTGLGSILAGGNRLFVGVEINEMPIQNFLFTIQPKILQRDEEISSLKSWLRELSSLYTLSIDGKPFQLTKIVFDSKEGQLMPVVFEGLMQFEGIRTFSTNDKHFPSIFRAYEEKIRNLPTRESPTLGQNSRIAIGPNMRASDVFSPLNFETLYNIRELARTNKTAQLLIGSCLHLCRLTDAKSQSQFPFWKPKKSIHEKSAVLILEKYLAKILEHSTGFFDDENAIILETFEEWEGNKKQGILLFNGPVQNVLRESIPSESVDLVITDPPYFDQVAYSEYLKLYEFFTHFTSDLDNEIVESSRAGAGKTRNNFLNDLAVAFTEIRRVMKPDSAALIYFKDSKPDNLFDFISTLDETGLIFETQTHLPKASYTYKQNSSKENTVGGDSIMVFRAGLPSKMRAPIPNISAVESDQCFTELFSEYLKKNGPATLTEALDNGIIVDLYYKGALANLKKSSYFFDTSARHFNYEPSSRKWSLRK